MIHGEPCVLWSATDVTAQKRAAAELEANRQRLSAALASMTDAVFISDRHGNFIEFNEAFATFHKFRSKAECARTLAEYPVFLDVFGHDGSLTPLDQWAVTRALRGETDTNVEFSLRRKDTGEKWAGSYSFAPIRGDGGEVVGSVVVARDITASRAAQQLLRLHGAALEVAANAVMISNYAGRIEWVNPAFTALSGWSFEEALGKIPGALLNSDAHDEAFHRQMHQTVYAGKVWRGEIVNRRKDGALRTVEMTVTPLRDASGQITHFISIKQDITERKALEAQNRQAQRMEAIGTLASGIAHDLNNILAPMLMVSGLLKEKLPDESDQEILAMLHQGAQRGANIIKQLLTFSRGQGGERVAVQSRHILKEMVAIMRETFPKEIDLRISLPALLPLINADPTQLHQVVLNLCVNARDAMPDGGRLSLSAASVKLREGDPHLPPEKAPGDFVVIEVRDSGHGIPPEIKHRIFDPFFTTKPLGKGTGLGLSTVMGIVRSHQGFITVDSQPGQGSSFKVFLPAVTESVAPEEPVADEPAAAGRGQLILIVDDERNVRDAVRLVLASGGFRSLSAVNGKDALTQYLSHRREIALVLTDVMMPVMNGIALIRSLQALDVALPLVVMSGMSEVAQQAELAALGVTDILPKPFDDTALLEAIERQLAAKK
jgi:PAS domain S-box-containing protein